MRFASISTTMTLPSSITTGASGKRNPSAISSNSAISSPLLSQPHCAFPPIMPVRKLFATNFYEADIGSPELLADREESSRLLAETDGAGRPANRAHGHKGKTG